MGLAQLSDPTLAEAQAGSSASVLAREHAGDRLVVVVGGETAHQRDRVLRGGAVVGLALATQRERRKMCLEAAVPSDARIDRACVALDSHANLGDQRAQQQLAVPLAGAWRVEDRPQVCASVREPLKLRGRQRALAPRALGGELGLGALDLAQPLLPGSLQRACDKAVLGLAPVELAPRALSLVVRALHRGLKRPQASGLG